MRFTFLVFLLITALSVGTLNSKEVKDFYFKSENFLQIDQKGKTINANGKVKVRSQGKNINADNLYIEYTDINNINLDTVNKIEATSNVKMKNMDKTITSDKYVFSKSSNIHVFEAIKNNVIYKDKSYKLIAKDRIEYFVDKSEVVIRGQPVVYGKSSGGKYEFHSNLMNAQLKTVNNKQDLDYVEGIDNVRFISEDNKIYGNYAIYYKDEDQIEFHGNIIIKNIQGTLKACGAIINLKSNSSSIINCKNNNSKIKGIYDKSNK